MDVRHPLNRLTASLLIAVLCVDPRILHAVELALDSSAGGNASLGQAANGVPLVNIATPSASGLSHNKFSDYNVGQSGLILNNSNQALAPTQLGGYITANPNLAGGSASLILNEVTGSNVSRLEGYTEVAGQAAHVVVANPHGISCDGCGFINTPRATLTTGTPQIDNGALNSYDVNRGKITIEGAGVNAANVGQFELITRAAEINADVYAQQLTVVTGRNEVDAQSLAASAKAGSGGAAPAVAIDSSALGGMYAGAIRLVGTEAGVGVRLAGDLAASAGDIHIDANGQLTLARSAAAENLAIEAENVALLGDTFAGGSARVQTGRLDVQESLAAGNRIEVAAQSLNNTGTLEAGVHADGSIDAAGEMELSGGVLTNSGQVRSHGTLTLDMQKVGNPGDIVAAGDVRLKTSSLENSGQLLAQQDLEVEAQQLVNQGALGAAGNVRIESATLDNDQGLLFSGADMTLRGENLTNRQGDILSLGTLDVAADDQGARSASLENISGTIESAGDMHLAVDQLLNRKDRFAATQQRVSGKITVTGTDNCRGDHCEATYRLEERYAPKITDDSAPPMLASGGNLSFVGERFENRLGSVSARGDISIEADQFFNVGAGGGRERQASFYIYDSNETAYWNFIRNLGRYNGYNDPESPTYDPQALSFESIAMGWQTGGGWVDTSGEAPVNALVQAGGQVSINASQVLENAVIRPGGSGSPHLNRQLPPDLAQRLVDPLALPGFGLPAGSGGLFRLNNDPGHRYLVESNPLFASLGNFLSSDYMLGLLGYSIDGTQRRLGDGLYEQRLIREAIIARTGKRFLADALASDEAQFQYLMDNGLASQQALNLSVGVALSPEQVAALTREIVWMEEREVEGQRVLVPVLYLPQADDRLAPTGAVIQGSDLTLASGGGLYNGGTLRGGVIDISAMSLANRGLAQSDARLSLLTVGDVRNSHGGILAGDQVEVTSLFGDVLNERSVASNIQQNGRFNWRDDVVDSAARIEAGSDLVIYAGQDLRNNGAVMQSGGRALLTADRDVLLDAVTEADSNQMLFKKFALSTRQVSQHGGDLEVAENLSVSAGRDIGVEASRIRTGANIDLYAGRDLALSAAANQWGSEFFRKGSGKKLYANSSRVQQQATSVESGAAMSLVAGNDLTLVGSRAYAEGDVSMAAGRDVSMQAALDQRDSAYMIRRSGSLGRKSSKSGHAAVSQAVASEVRSGGSIRVNTVLADGTIQLTGGRDLAVDGSRLIAEQDISLGASRDVRLASVSEQRSSSSLSDRSSPLAKSSSIHTQSSILQARSQLNAGRDLLLVAGKDVQVRASTLMAGRDVELYAGVVDANGGIALSAAEDQHQYFRDQQSKRIGLSTGNMLVSSSASKKLGEAGELTRQIGSEAFAGRDAIFRAAQDITVAASAVGAERDVMFGAGRDIHILSSAEPYWSRLWKSDRKNGIDLHSDGNGFTAFLGSSREKTERLAAGHNLEASEIAAGRDLLIDAGRDYRQQGSDLLAAQDIVLRAAGDLQIEAGMERESRQLKSSLSRNGITSNLNHNFDSTLDTIGKTGQGENATSQVSSVLKTVDTVSQFLAGPTVGDHIGSTSTKNSYREESYRARPATLSAGRDIDARAGESFNSRGGVFDAGRDIILSGRDLVLDVARGWELITQQQTRSQGGINAGATANSARVGIGGSQGTITDERTAGHLASTALRAGRDIDLDAVQDLTLAGTRASADRNINLTAGHDLSIGAAGIESGAEHRRRTGGGEVGVALGGSDFIAIYVSADVGRGDLDREAESQKKAYLQAGERLTFSSGRDTSISGAHLEADEIVGRVQRNLTVSSLPDTGQVNGKELDASVTVSIGYGTGSVSGSIGVGKTTGKTNWVQEQTTLHSRDLLDIHAGEHTQVDGALIYSDTGNLKLDTNTFAFRDIKGEDREHSWYLRAGGSMGFGDSGGAAGTDGAGAAHSAVVTDSSQQGKGNDGSSGWSLSGYDYKHERSQLLRATIGDGEIIVRNDDLTGADSLAGLNRNSAFSQIGLTDKSRKTDFYASSSSIASLSNSIQTFDEWKKGLENYGKSTVQAYKNYKELSGKAEEESGKRSLLKPFSVIATTFVGVMNYLNGKTLGVIPGSDNHGGLMSQIPVLISGDGELYRVYAPLERNEDGSIKYEAGKPVRDIAKIFVSEFYSFVTGDFLFTNGILNSPEEAMVNAAMQTGQENFVKFYNPTHGAAGDLAESMWDVLFGTILPSGISREMRTLQEQAGTQEIDLNNIAHSQGGLILATALRGVAGDNEGVVQMSGAPISAVSFHRIAQAAGYINSRSRLYQVNRPEEYIVGSVPKTDPISDFLGLNFQYSDKPGMRFLGAVMSFGYLFGDRSDHSNYACWVCADDVSEQGRLVRESLPVPKFIDENGRVR